MIMELQKFTAQRFRNLQDLDLSPGSGMNVIFGENAQGKTNLLEAIFILSTLRSFRTRHLSETLQFGELGGLLQGMVQCGQSKHQLGISLGGERERQLVLNRKKVDTLQYIGVFNVFLFSYPLLEVIRGGPEERRKFLDRSIAISKPGYLPVLLQYHRAVRQKNALLQSLQRAEVSRKETIEEIRSFNVQLLQHGLEVVSQRSAYVTELQQLLQNRQDLFFDSDVRLSTRLRSSFLAPEKQVETTMERGIDREIAYGSCLFGAHRDEVLMTMNDRELRKYGSSGQHRAFLLLLLLAQLELYERWREDRPVLLLDDLDSELDQRRIRSFLEAVKTRYQTFISSSRPELFSGNGDMRRFEILSGKLLER
jgi:DNA replication and repair protein RecF